MSGPVVTVKKIVENSHLESYVYILSDHVSYFCNRLEPLDEFDGGLPKNQSLLCCCCFCSPEHNVLMVSYCDRPLSVVRRA